MLGKLHITKVTPEIATFVLTDFEQCAGLEIVRLGIPRLGTWRKQK